MKKLLLLLVLILPGRAYSGVDEFDPMVPGMVSQVSQVQYTQYLQSLVGFGTRNSYHPNCDSAAAWILEQFQGFGLDVYYDIFPLPGGTIRRNVVGERLGNLYPDSVLFITAHYDATAGNPSVPEAAAPGADNNGSGAACVLECARILSQYNFAFTVRFVLFAGNEQGMAGSYYYTNHIQTGGARVRGVFNYDMIAYSGNGPGLIPVNIYHDGSVFGETVLAWKVDEAMFAFTPETFNPTITGNPSLANSDQYNFWQKGWPGTLVAHAVTNPFNHTPQDIVGNCDLEFATNLTRVALAALADVALPLDSLSTISGPVHGTWTIQNNPYLIADSIYVPQDSTLVIEPGVMVVFQGQVPLKVMPGATLKVLGSSDLRVLFTSTNYTVGWAGIRFLNASDSSRLEFCTIGYANNAGSSQYPLGGGIFCDNTSLRMDHVLIHHAQANSGGAVALVNGSHAQMNHVTFASNSAEQGSGIYCENSSPVVSNSILWDVAPEITAAGSSDPQIIWSDVLGGFPGEGNLNANPEFVGTGNYHLQSTAGSFSGGGWMPGLITSPCMDAADPAAPWNLEPEPNGDRADMGFAGNTPEASFSPNDAHYVLGLVSGTWTAANNPMHVIGDLTVTSGDTLRIGPGVQVIFENHHWGGTDHFSLTVQNGALLTAQGSVQDSILFIPSDPAAGWGGLRFENADDSCRLAFCRISYATFNDDTGGGIFCGTSGLTISRSVINHCRAAFGGGLYASNSHVRLENTLFTVDSAASPGAPSWGGGAIWSIGSQITAVNSSFLDNYSGGNGGMAFIWAGQIQMTNCLFAGNFAEAHGGAIYSTGAPLHLVNCTFTGNQANPTGTTGAVHALGFVPFTIDNCILWNNSPQQIEAYGGAVAQVQYSDVMGGWTGTGNLDVNPVFEAGSFSAWQLSSASSPCVDAGIPGAEYNDPEDLTNPGQALYPALGLLRNDMGAYGGPQTSSFLGVTPEEESPLLPMAFSLSQNRPNPFNQMTDIRYQMTDARHISLKVYDLTGRLVRSLVDGRKPAGRYSVVFDGSGLASGMYFVQMKAGDFVAVKKMVMLK